MTGILVPQKHGGAIRRGGGAPRGPRTLGDDFFKTFRDGDPKLGLKPRKERLTDLLLCGDPQVVVRVEQLLIEHEVGKPVQAVQHSGEISMFAIETNAPKDRAAWLEANAESAAQLEEADAGVN